jgi:GMP synthase (glutamine-hydrolysing)
MEIRLLLLQARNEGDPAKEEERISFARKLGLSLEKVVTHDLLTGVPSFEEVVTHTALLMGGAGEFYVSKKNLPDFHGLLDLLREVVDSGFPTFASCFGFHCLVTALGGEIVHDAERTQVGTYELSLTEQGRRDALLGSILPNVFAAQLGRKDLARSLPDGIPNLAESKLCRFQAFRIPDKPIWAFQFHPELNADENRLRFIRYMDGYATALSPSEREKALTRFTESKETELLLRRFLHIVTGGNGTRNT